MLIPKNAQIEKAVSKEQYRPSMQNVYFHDNKLVATNGQIIAIVPVTECQNDSEGYLSPECLVEARKEKKMENSLVNVNGEIDLPLRGLKMNRPENIAYPDYMDCIPNDAAVFTVKINPRLLMDLAESIGLGKDKGLILEFISPTKAIRVKTENNDAEGTGLIMPMRILA